jgi:ABC-type multidrug transport system fused ATPase/permease subunit
MRKKYRIAITVFIITAVVITLRQVITHNTGVTIAPSSLFASAVGGVIFLIAFMLSGTVSDYKESEKLPGEVAAYLENIHDEGRYAKSMNAEFKLDKLDARIVQIIEELKADLLSDQITKKSIDTVALLTESALEMEALKIPAGYISRVKADRDNTRKTILRMYQIKATSFLPAAAAILEILTVAVVGGLMIVKLDKTLESVMLPGVTMFFIMYMVAFVRDLDDPFAGNVAVDMFLLDDLKAKLRK